MMSKYRDEFQKEGELEGVPPKRGAIEKQRPSPLGVEQERISAGIGVLSDKSIGDSVLSSRDILWKQYELNADLYKHYLELMLKFNVFFYAVTGAILSFYFSKTDVGVIKYSLLLPIIMSICFGVLFIYAANAVRVVRQEMFDIRDKLDLDTAPEFNVLIAVLIISSILLFTVAGVIGWFFFSR
jgi:hypothetical protein